MGLSLISFALKDISDTQGYLDALSKPMIAAAKQAAAIAQAEADKEAVIKSSEAKRESDIARLKAEAAIAGRAWENETLKAQSQINVNKKKAEADISYEMERTRLMQELKKEEYQIKLLEVQEQAKVQQEEIVRKEKELQASVIKPAEARKFQVQAEAEAESFRISKEAEGRSEAKKKENAIDADRVRKMGEAEAESMTLKAKAFEQYNQAAMYKMIVDILPELARSVSEPLSRIDKIVMLSGDGSLDTSKITGQVAHTLAQLPDVVKALTGVDLAKYLREKMGGGE
jgi:flotillin